MWGHPPWEKAGPCSPPLEGKPWLSCFGRKQQLNRRPPSRPEVSA